MTCNRVISCIKCRLSITANNFPKHSEKCLGKGEKSKNSGKRGGWNKGITLKSLLDSNLISQDEYKHRLDSVRRGGQNSPGQPLNEADRLNRNEKCRENAIKNKLGGHTSKIKIFYVRKDGTTVYLQSSYEVRFAILLDELNIAWSRPEPLVYVGSDGKKHRYYPDFKVGEIYLDPKNDYLAIKDLPKIARVREQCSVDIRIVTKELICKEYVATLV